MKKTNSAIPLREQFGRLDSVSRFASRGNFRKSCVGWLMGTLTALVIGSNVACGQVTAETAGWTVFDVPGLEAPAGTPVDFSFLNIEPAGNHGFIRVKDGKFVDDRNIPIRFFGTNLTGDACFPDPEDGVKLAKRFRQYGFNCLRLHFMDANHVKAAIWEDPEKGVFNEMNLRKLDQFIVACNKEGIYINLNLHVARYYPNQPSRNDFTMGKVLDRWYPPYIDMQVEYARKLVGRVNTVTGKRYADNAGIMCIELNNENTMIADFRGKLEKLPAEFTDSFQKLWNDWLIKKYGNENALRKSWNRYAESIGNEVITDKEGWYAENGGGAVSTILPGADGGWQWHATKQGSAEWNLQLQIRRQHLEPRLHTVKFEARSKTSSKVIHSIMLEAEPWQTLGLTQTIYLTPEWKTFEFNGIVAEAVNGATHRVNFSLSNQIGDVEIRNYSIRTGGGKVVTTDQTFAKGIPVPGMQSSLAQMTDFFDFLTDTEMNTERRLLKVLREELGCRMPICDSQISYGAMGGLKREATLSDYSDIHAYWQHPSYTYGKNRQVTSFSIGNTAAVANEWGGCIAQLASWRVEGKPFSVSEYNAPAPSDYCADMFPLFSVIACVQDWDAFFSYTYRDFGRDYANTFIRGYFQFIGRASMLVHVPFASYLFRKNLMPVASNRTVIAVPEEKIPEMAYQKMTPLSVLNKCGGTPVSALSQRLTVRIQKGLNAPKLLEGNGKAKIGMDGAFESEDGSYRIFPKAKTGAWATLNLPSARLLSGHVGGQTFTVGDVSISVGARPWPKGRPAFACITLLALDERPVSQSRRLLLAASARSENTNMPWNDERTTLLGIGRERWGKPPVVSELVPLTLALPMGGNVRLTPLAADGTPLKTRVCTSGNIAIKSEDASLWFLIER